MAFVIAPLAITNQHSAVINFRVRAAYETALIRVLHFIFRFMGPGGAPPISILRDGVLIASGHDVSVMELTLVILF